MGTNRRVCEARTVLFPLGSLLLFLRLVVWYVDIRSPNRVRVSV
jgi:hypothetical protein